MATTRKPASTEADDDTIAQRTREEIQELLAEAFDEDLIEFVPIGDKKFPNVAPQHYISKLLDIVPGYFDVNLVTGPTLHVHGDAAAIVTGVQVDIHHPNFEAAFSGVGAEPADDSDESKYFAYKFKSSFSDALKLATKPAGVGLDLYNMEPEENDDEPPAKAKKPASKVTNIATKRKVEVESDEDTDKEEDFPKLGFGKHKELTMDKVPGSYLKWAAGEPKHNEKTDKISFGDGNVDDKYGKLTLTRKEVARRVRADIWDPEEGNDRGKGGKTQYGKARGNSGPDNF